MGAQLETITLFFPQEQIDEMHLCLHICREEATVHRGPSGAVLVVMSLADPDLQVNNVFPVAFSLDQGDVEELEMPWINFLIWRLSEGIVE